MFVCVQGKLVPEEEATISVRDRGFLYGDGVFETIHVYQGVPFAWGAHWDRLCASATFIELKVNRSSSEIKTYALELLKKNRLLEGEAALRIQLTRGGSQWDYADEPKEPTWVLYAKPVDRRRIDTLQQGVRCGTISADWLSPKLAQHKTTNYLPSVIASRLAKRKGWYEVFFKDHQDHILEGATSNIFIVKGRTLKTPPLRESLLAGITRRTVMELAPQLGLSVAETPISHLEVLEADEVFLTSSIVEIVPILELDGRGVRSSPGPFTTSLQASYCHRVAP